jgi:putative membrane protein
VRRPAIALGLVLVAGAWVVAAAPLGMTGHMAAHMVAVAVAAPLLAWGLAGTSIDPAERWPGVVTPLAMSVLELAVVWAWHLPTMRDAAARSTPVLAAEQASFLAAGLLLWSAVLGTRAASADRRAAGVAALLLTSMHMTLLGALVGLAPRTLYADHPHAAGLAPLADQQLGGVVMLMIGAASYFIGGLAMLAGLIRSRAVPA